MLLKGKIWSEYMLLGIIPPPLPTQSLEVITPNDHLSSYLAGNGLLLNIYIGLKRGLREK
jgi:hypothetical protein